MPARILIIEDNPANMELMVYLLQAFGHVVLSAFNGEEGLEMARRALPDLILCDVHLPKMDGYGVLQQLKADAALRRIPVIAATALAMVGDRQKLLAAGFDGYLGKPIEPEAFIGQVEQFLSSHFRSPPMAIEPAVMNPDSAAPGLVGRGRILVVDDILNNREFIRCVMEPCGYEVVLTSDVRHGIACAQASDFDLILCDLYMPDEDGITFIRAAKSDPRLCTVPFIFISASRLNTDCQRGLLEGAVSFIQIPIEPDRLIQEVEDGLRRARQKSPAC